MNDWEGEFVLVDGKQRINAVRIFLENRLKIFGYYFKEYSGRFDSIICDFVFHINNLKDYNEVIKWYVSMNSGGSIHTEEDIKRALNCLT
jgi:hypothetical protein